MTDGRTSRAISEAFVDAALDIRCRACDGKGRVPAFWYGRWRECMACGGTGTSRAGQAARVLAEADTLRRELDKARAEADVLVQQVGVEGAMRAAAEAQAARYQEALERIAAFHHAPGKTYKAAWVESVRIAREALGGGDDE